MHVYEKRAQPKEGNARILICNAGVHVPVVVHRHLGDCFSLAQPPSNIQNASQERICTDKYRSTCTEKDGADQTPYLAQSQHTATRPGSPSTLPLKSGTWLGAGRPIVKSLV